MLKRTTLFAEEEALEELRHLADEEGKSLAELTREAIRMYLDKRQPQKPLASLIGIGDSGGMNMSERADELLWQNSRHRRRLKKRKR